MKLSISLFAAIISLAAASSSDPNCLTTCTPLSKVATNCGYDITSSAESTDSQTLCMCKSKSFVSEYQSCQECLHDIGVLSDSDWQSSQLIQSACNLITGTSKSDARALSTGGVGHVLASLAVTVGLGFYGILA